MKKANLLFLILIPLLFSCKKVVTEANLASDVDVKSTNRNMNVSLDEMVKNPLDKEDEAFNQQLYLLGKGVMEIVKDQDNLQKLINAARTSQNSDVNLNCFLNTWQNCKCTFNTKLEETLTDRSIGDNHCEYVTSRMVYKNISYWPMLYLSNAATAETGKGYYVAIGTEININVGEYENEIPAWWVKPNGEIKVVTIREDNLIGGNTPIIIVSNGAEPVAMINGGPTNGVPGVAPVEPPMGVAGSGGNSYNLFPNRYRVSRYRLSERFENIGKSEFCVFLGAIPTALPIEPGNYTAILQDIKIADVDKDDINRNLYNSFSLFSAPDGNRFMFFLTFERDGWASPKPVSIANSGSSNQITISIKAKYSNEVYHFGSGVQLDSSFPNVGNYQTYYRYGEIDIQRAN